METKKKPRCEDDGGIPRARRAPARPLPAQRSQRPGASSTHSCTLHLKMCPSCDAQHAMCAPLPTTPHTPPAQARLHRPSASCPPVTTPVPRKWSQKPPKLELRACHLLPRGCDAIESRKRCKVQMSKQQSGLQWSCNLLEAAAGMRLRRALHGDAWVCS